MRKSAWFLLFPLSLLANPSGARVVAGHADLQADGNLLSISAADRTIIEWSQFTIEEGETAKFIQPGFESAVLNKVVGNLPSALLGQLLSNGKVLLINPNGILVGPTCSIDAGAIAFSTLPLLDDQAFLDNEPLHFCSNAQTYLHQQGTIVAHAGDIELIGPSVTLEGKAIAEKGGVRIGAGSDILLLPEGEERILIQPTKFKSLFGIDLRGQIQALQTELKADGNAYALAICVGEWGKISATEIEEKNGKVWLVAEAGDVWMKGEINAPGAEVQVLGKSVILAESARIDVSSNAPGSIYVGGGCHGVEPLLYPSERTLVAPGAILTSQSLDRADGGRVILWSDGFTSFQGSINAEGGPRGGNGGFVEVSGFQQLDYRGTVSTLAPQGTIGTLLLDPFLDITIVNAGPSVGVIATPTSFTPMAGFACAPGPGNSLLFDMDVNVALASNSVTIDTASTSAPGNPCPGDIIFAPGSVVNGLAATNLILLSARDIDFRGDVFLTGALFATAERDINIGSGGGFINTVSISLVTSDLLSLTSNTGSINILGGTGIGSANAQVAGNLGATISAVNGAFNVIGGNAAMGADAFIQVSGNPINVTAGSFLAQGGSSANSCVGQVDSFGSFGVDTYTISGDMTLQGGTSDSNNSHAVLGIFGANDISIVCGGEFRVQGGSATMGGTPDARINASGGGAISLEAGNIVMLGGSTDVTDSGIADISGAANVTVVSHGSMSMSTTPGTALNKSVVTAFGGTTTINVAGDMIQTGINGPNEGSNVFGITITVNVGGNYTLTGSNVFGSGGPVTVTVGNDLVVNMTGTESNITGIISFSPTPLMSVTAGRDITLSGVSKPFILGGIVNFGDVDVIAGRNLSILDFGIVGSAIDGSNINLVVDNDFPSAPGIGPGAFLTQVDAVVGASLFGASNNVRIFTARRSQNSINSLLNGASFVPGPFLQDTNEERWGVYFFNPFYDGGSFVIFYKESGAFFTQVTPFPDFLELFRVLHPFSEYIDLSLGFTVTDYTRPNYYFLRRRVFQNIELTDVISRTQDPADLQRPLFNFD